MNLARGGVRPDKDIVNGPREFVLMYLGRLTLPAPFGLLSAGTSSPPRMWYEPPRQRMVLRKKLAAHITKAKASQQNTTGILRHKCSCFKP